MNNIKLLILLIAFVVNSGCATIGPTLMIETPEPVDDFVVLCQKTKDYLIGHNASVKNVTDNVIVASSGEEVSCGLMLGSTEGYFSLMHPLYRGFSSDEVDGVTIVRPKPKLQYLDELKTKFESGYWDKFKWPESRYATAVQPVCGFPHQYLGHYLDEKDKIDVERFKKNYDEAMFECTDRVYAIMKKYYRGFSKDADARHTMDLQWDKLRELNRNEK